MRRNMRSIRINKGSKTRKIRPDLWESINAFDAKAASSLEKSGVKKVSKGETRSLLAQMIDKVNSESEFEIIGPRRRKEIHLLLRRSR